MNPRTPPKQQQKGSAMSVMYPLAIVNTASITNLVRMTLYHHSISVYPTQVETNEGVATLGRKVRDTAAKNLDTQPMSDIPGVRSIENQMDIEEAKNQ
jgi:osmotically-inducible protein OsmY